MTTIPLHMGALHPFEQALTLLLAFGPFVLLGIVVWLRRRQDDRSVSHADPAAKQSPSRSADGSERLS